MFLGKYISGIWKPFQHLYTMFFVMVGWLIFRVDSITYGLDYLLTMFGLRGQALINNQAIYYLMQYKYVLILSIIGSVPIYPFIKRKLGEKSTPWIGIIIIDYIEPFLLISLFLLCIMYLINSTFNPFIYFRF